MYSKLIRLSLVVLILTVLLPLPVLAQGTEPPSPFDLTTLVAELGALAGFGAFIAFIVNALKTLKIVKDGDAPKYAGFLNLLLLIGLFSAKVFAPQMEIGKMDALAATLAQIGLLVLGLVVQMLGSKVGHFSVTGIPIIGKSYSYEKESG